MLRLKRIKNKSGFTIVEVMCSIAIFCLTSLFTVDLLSKAFEIKSANMDNEKYDYIMEIIINKLQYDTSYEEIKNISEMKTCYINKEKLENNIIINSKVKDIISSVEPIQEYYAVINIEKNKDKDLVFKIKITLYTKILNREGVREWQLFKGDYVQKDI